MAPRVHSHRPSQNKDLGIEVTADYYDLYLMWQEVDADLAYAGLGMPSTFADHLNRINSTTKGVKEAEMKWFEALVKSTYLLTEHQFRNEGPNPSPDPSRDSASQAVSSVAKVYPTLFITGPHSAIPRLLPHRMYRASSFDIVSVHPPMLAFHYTQQQLAHCVRIIATVSPYDTLHNSKANRKHECIGKLHAGRPEWTVKEVCPDLVFGVICGDCNAEGFVVANFLLARSGLSGEANTESIPVAVLRIMASSFFAYPTMTPFEDMIWAFGASTYTSEQITNGCEIRAWNILQKEKYFKRLETWYPKSLTRTAHLAQQDQLVVGSVKPQIVGRIKREREE